MALQKKIVVAAIATITILGLFFYTTKTIFVRGFAEIEEQSTQRDVERILAILSNEVMTLDSTTADWAYWDDTYSFVVDSDRGFIENNLSDLTLLRLRLSMMLFINRQGGIVYGKGVDLSEKKEMPVSANMADHLQAGSILINHANTEGGVKGILLLPESPMLVSSQPILTSQGKGPANGRLITGRYLDSVELKRLSDTTQLSVSLCRLDNRQMPADYRKALSSLSEEKPVFIQSLGEDVIAGYAMLKDIYQKPCLLIKVDVPRQIYTQSKTSMLYLILLLLALLMMLGVLLLLLIENREREEAEEKLGESEERFRIMADNAPVLLWMSDTSGLCTFFNKGWLNFTGRSMGQDIGDGWVENVHPEDKNTCLGVYISAFKQRKNFEMEYRLRRADGEYRWVLDTGVPRFTPNGSFSGYIGSCMDITGRKLAEEALRKNEASLANAQRIAHFGNWDWDIVKNELRWSDEIYRIFGLSPRVFRAAYESFLDSVHPDDRDFVNKSVDDALYRNKPYSIDHRIVLPDGTERIVHEQAEVTFDDDGRAIFMSGTVQDITDRKRAEAELAEARKKAERAERMASLGTLSAGIAHEINQPLNSLKIIADGMLYWHERGRALDIREVAGSLSDISVQASRIDRIIKRMRSLVREEKLADIGPCDINSAVEGALNVLSNQLSFHGIKVIKTLRFTLPVRGDRYGLEEVVINLAGNAMQALAAVNREHREICISTFAEENIILEISDNATGISEELRDKIFNPFFTTKEAGEGMGLGLCIAHSIVTSFGGNIHVSNNEKGGATFRVELPVFNIDFC